MERQDYLDIFKLDGKKNILLENDFGIVNGKITAGVNFRDAFSISGLWAPPYVSSDFSLEIRLFGEKVPVTDYTWYPFSVIRNGIINGIKVSSSSLLVNGTRALVIRFLLENTTLEDKNTHIQIITKGGIDFVHMWDFPRPTGTKTTDILVKKSRIIKSNNNKAIVINTDIENLTWHNHSCLWESEIKLAAGSTGTYNIVVSIGEKQEAINTCGKIVNDLQNTLDETYLSFENIVKNIYEKLPVFNSSDERLTAFYNRSLVHYVTNQWQVPEFIFNPLYTTGSIKGGCLASYLYDYSEGWEMHPLFDPDATREHIKQYLKIDITNCFSFDPMTGIAIGPWYPVNQEKIIGLIYYYVLHTGDAAFLNEIAGKKTVLDWVLYHATLGDDINRPVELFDYSIDGEHHLELRRGFPYHGVMPDLNGRRYLNYKRASELLDLSGKSGEYLRERAETIKTLLKNQLWSPEDKWFYFVTDNEKMLRYTIQMFKLINSPVLDDDELKGLLSHINEDEFLSPYGIHSMSKMDPAFDQVDIDNGGGGCYTSFPPQILEFLYKAGYPDYAEEILKRILWWGEKTPYWGDSFVANYIDYRSDTPLQCTIGSVAGAQCIIFGMFGVTPMFNGNLIFNPNPPSFSRFIELKGVKIRDCIVDISVDGNEVKVDVNGRSISSRVGIPVLYTAETKKLNYLYQNNTNLPQEST